MKMRYNNPLPTAPTGRFNPKTMAALAGHSEGGPCGSPMKPFAIIAAVVLVLIGIILVPLRIRTVQAMDKIRALEGQTGEFHSLASSVSTKYSTIEDSTQIEKARVKLGLTARLKIPTFSIPSN